MAGHVLAMVQLADNSETPILRANRELVVRVEQGRTSLEGACGCDVIAKFGPDLDGATWLGLKCAQHSFIRLPTPHYVGAADDRQPRVQLDGLRPARRVGDNSIDPHNGHFGMSAHLFE